MVVVSAEPSSLITQSADRSPGLSDLGYCVPWLLPADIAERIEALLRQAVIDVAGGLAAPLLRIVGAGGKRLRPALTIAVARIGNGDRIDPELIALASAVELLHCATLVHDDLIDEAPTRRGVPTLSAREGLSAAVVGGDLLIAAAMRLAGGVGGASAVVIADTLAQLCRGEVLQEQHRYDADVSTEASISINAAKTGSLLRAACLLGAAGSDMGPEQAAAAGRFGLDFGISLQLVDDLLDIVSTPALAGKPVHADFAAGTVTFPAALALHDSPRLRQYLRPGLSQAGIHRSSALLQECDQAIAATAAAARRFARSATESLLDAVGNHPAAERLARWPLAYVDAQLATKVGPRHQSLLTQLIGSA